MAQRHFFPSFNSQLAKLADPRRQEQVSYPLGYVIWQVLLMLLGGGGSRRQWSKETDRPGFLRSLIATSGISGQSAAHPDTCFYLLGKLDPLVLVRFQAQLVRRLLRMRCLERFRFWGQWLVAVDGTWLRSYNHPHCDRCLHQTKDGVTTYFHAVLEAKLVLANGMKISLCSVPIENTAGPYAKQDCELKAFERLARLLADLFPRLPICLIGDSLYACEPVLDICAKRRWGYILVFKPGRTPSLWQEAVRRWGHCHARDYQRLDAVRQKFRWVKALTYGSHRLNAIECQETATDGTQSTWAWITDFSPNRKDVADIANNGGRAREKIEQAFNEQKNGPFKLRHDYGSQARAWYNLYILVQVAHLLMQLIVFSDLTRKLSNGRANTFEDTFGTIRNFIRRLAESIQRDVLDQNWCGANAPPIQIRFSSA